MASDAFQNGQNVCLWLHHPTLCSYENKVATAFWRGGHFSLSKKPHRVFRPQADVKRYPPAFGGGVSQTVKKPRRVFRPQADVKSTPTFGGGVSQTVKMPRRVFRPQAENKVLLFFRGFTSRKNFPKP